MVSKSATYGNLWRVVREGRCRPRLGGRKSLIGLKVAARYSARWAKNQDGPGYIYSFKRPTAPLGYSSTASFRSIDGACASRLGSAHGRTARRLSCSSDGNMTNTGSYNIVRREGGTPYDVTGRTAMRVVFNQQRRYRCHRLTQGYSPS